MQGPGDLPFGRRSSLVVRRLSAGQRAKLARGARVLLVAKVNKAGRVTASARARIGGRARLVGFASKRAAKAGTVKLGLRLSKAAQRRLRRVGALNVRLSVGFSGLPQREVLSFRLRAGGSRNGR
jgi:hypothetical protein